jgi:hypothetical protein
MIPSFKKSIQLTAAIVLAALLQPFSPKQASKGVSQAVKAINKGWAAWA